MGRLRIALAAGVGCVALGFATAASGGAGGTGGAPDIDHKPEVESVVIDKRSGRDRAIVLARFDNPLDDRADAAADLAPGGAGHRARIRLRLGGAEKGPGVARAAQTLPFGSGETQQVQLVVAVPGSLDPATATQYEAKLVHVLDPADAAQANERAKATVTGTVASPDGLGKTPIRSLYVNGSAGASLSVSSNIAGLYVSEVKFAKSTCGYDVAESRAAYAVRPDWNTNKPHGEIPPNATTGPTPGYEFDLQGDGGWGWVFFNPYDLTSESVAWTNAAAALTGVFSPDGSRVTVKMQPYSWTLPSYERPPNVASITCKYPKQTVTLTAAR